MLAYSVPKRYNSPALSFRGLGTISGVPFLIHLSHPGAYFIQGQPHISCPGFLGITHSIALSLKTNSVPQTSTDSAIRHLAYFKFPPTVSFAGKQPLKQNENCLSEGFRQKF